MRARSGLALMRAWCASGLMTAGEVASSKGPGQCGYGGKAQVSRGVANGGRSAMTKSVWSQEHQYWSQSGLRSWREGSHGSGSKGEPQ